MAVLISRYPIQTWKAEADAAGVYRPPGTIYTDRNSIPMVQLFTIEELMDARNNRRASPIILPELTDITFERKPQEVIFEGRGTEQKSSGTQDLPLSRFE